MSNDLTPHTPAGSGILAMIRASAGAVEPIMARRVEQAWRIRGLPVPRGPEDEALARKLLDMLPHSDVLREQADALARAVYGAATEDEREAMFSAMVDRNPNGRWIENKLIYIEGLAEDTNGYSCEVIYTAARRIRRESHNLPAASEFLKAANKARDDYVSALKATDTMLERRFKAEDILDAIEIEASCAAGRIDGTASDDFNDDIPF
ncbi:hypothetical protein AMST5_00061 [freshwater sediment metagenome]|uniref:Uncharacterized protein n=1 Tax=freshwater sediment metagenome TaxID=556182 RepID=A0AA48R903_9ZZZZ